MQVGATGVSMVQRGVPDDLTSSAPVNPGIAVGVVIAVLVVVGITVAIILIVIVFYLHQKRTHRGRYSPPPTDGQLTDDDEERYVESLSLLKKQAAKDKMEASEMQEKKPLLTTGVTTITNEATNDADQVEGEEGEEVTEEKPKIGDEAEKMTSL